MHKELFNINIGLYSVLLKDHLDFVYHKPDNYKSASWTAGRLIIKNA